jgi:2-keto-4-pentenoate hydratase/2-oxohepta-3-ene-1,7-dioic acid hydratase in catechol pathway
MRLVSYIRNGVTRVGVLRENDEVVDVNRALGARFCDEGVPRPELAADALNPASMIDLLAVGAPALEAIRATLAWIDGDALSPDEHVANGSVVPASEVRLAAPVSRPGKVMAIGINYRAHASEMERELPEHPTVFTKVSTCIIGTGDAIHAPVESHMLDWEGELCVVIGKYARHVAAADALGYVAGYMNGNDVTVRDWQRHTPTWMMGKSWDTHGPTGPWILTADEVPDPSALELKTFVNDVEKQSAPTNDLLFNVPQLIEYISTAFTLEPGDVIFTGTPAGVGQARDPQEWLKAGDTVRVQISGLGSLENPVIAEPGR